MNSFDRHGATMPGEWKWALLGILTGCLLVILTLWPTVLDLTALWRRSVTYQFSWLVIPLLVYMLAWHHRQVTARVRPQPDFTGMPVAIAAAVCWGASGFMNIEAGRHLALILAVQGVVMSALGWRAYWRLFPILALLFFLVPVGDLLLPALRSLTVKGMTLFATVANLPHRVEGFVVWIGKNDYLVLSECGGLPYFLLATFLGYAFGLLLYRSAYKVIGVALLGTAIGVLYNALRVNLIVLADWIKGTQMPLAEHSTFHWLGLLLSLGLLFFVLTRLEEDSLPATREHAPLKSVSGLRRWAPVVAGFCVLLIAGTASWSMSRTSQVLTRSQTAGLPRHLSGWELGSPAPEWLVDTQSQTRSLRLIYHRNGLAIQIRILETLAADAKVQESELAPDDGGKWQDNSVSTETGCDATGSFSLLHTTWRNADTGELRHAYAAYAIGSLFTTSRFVVRAAHGWNRLHHGHSIPRLIGVTAASAAKVEAISEFAPVLRALQSALEAGGT